MSVLTKITREDAALAQANSWPDAIRPLIETYLDLGAMLDKLEDHFNGWKPANAGEQMMAQCHSALAKSHGMLRRDIEDYREGIIDDLTVDIDQYEALLDRALSVNDAVKAVAP